MTAGDEDRSGGWVPTEPPAAAPVTPEPPPLTRAARRETRETRETRKAEGSAGSSGSSASSASDTAGAPLAIGTTVALAVLVGLSAYAGSTATALAVLFAAVVMVWGWARLTNAPSPRSASVVVGAGAVAICLAVVLTRTEPYLVWAPAATAVSVVAAFLHQVLRPGGRPRLTEGVASSVSALAITACGVPLIPVPLMASGAGWVAVAMAAVALTALVTLGARRPRLRPWVLLTSVVLGTAAGVLTTLLVTGIPLLGAAVLALLVSAVTHALLRVLLALPGARFAQAAVSCGAATVLVTGALVYLVARVAAG